VPDRTAGAAQAHLIEFPADDAERARRFWENLLGTSLQERTPREGSGWQTHGTELAIGVHERGRGPGDTHALAYFDVADLDAALERVRELGGTVIHSGESFAVCRDSEGTPFGLARQA
jgi:predicted enzyme related to lactoylglutathione lyase